MEMERANVARPGQLPEGAHNSSSDRHSYRSQGSFSFTSFFRFILINIYFLSTGQEDALQVRRTPAPGVHSFGSNGLMEMERPNVATPSELPERPHNTSSCRQSSGSHGNFCFVFCLCIFLKLS